MGKKVFLPELKKIQDIHELVPNETKVMCVGDEFPKDTILQVKAIFPATNLVSVNGGEFGRRTLPLKNIRKIGRLERPL